MQICSKEESLDKFAVTRTLASFLINVMWMAQFAMLLVFRFSHPGKVCSGDYKKYNVDENAKDEASGRYNRDEQFDKYFLTSQGAFFYYYSTISIGCLLAACCLAGCCGCGQLSWQSRQTMDKIDHFFKNMDSFEGIMKKEQEKYYKSYAEAHGYDFKGQDQEKNKKQGQTEEEFRNVFKED